MRRFAPSSTSNLLRQGVTASSSSTTSKALSRQHFKVVTTASTSTVFLQDSFICKRMQSTVAAPTTPEVNGASDAPATFTNAMNTAKSTVATTSQEHSVVANKSATSTELQPVAPATTTLGFLGCGNMSAAILKGLVKASANVPKEAPPAPTPAQTEGGATAATTPAPAAPTTPTVAPLAPGDSNTFFRQLTRILVFDPTLKPGTKKSENFLINLKKMNPNLAFELLNTAEELAERSNVAVIGVKPQVARTVLYPLRGLWGKKTPSSKSVERPTVLVSVIAGETILSLEDMLLPTKYTDRIRREEEAALKQIELDDQIDESDELLASNPDMQSVTELERELGQEPSSGSAATQQQQQQETSGDDNNSDNTNSASPSNPASPNIGSSAPLPPSHLCVVRSMPNTPLLVGKGVSGYSVSTDNIQRAVGVQSDSAIPKATEKFIHDATSAILGSLQNTLAFVPESQLDAVSGVSGCGPAFVSMVVESLADGGVMQGLPRALANRLAAETVHGASAMLCGDKPVINSAAEMRHQVCSPGGATIMGVRILEQKGLRDALMCAVRESATRCGELRKEGEQQATALRKKQRVAAITKKRNVQYHALQKSQVKKRSGSGGRKASPSPGRKTSPERKA